MGASHSVIESFTKPQGPALSLRIGGDTGNCATCGLVIDPTLSSATVTLTRDILGKIQQPPLPYPPSNLPKLDSASATGPDQSGKNGCGGLNGGGAGPPGNVCCNNGCDYTVPYPNNGDKPTKLSWADGTLLSDHGTHRVDGNNTHRTWTDEFLAQYAEEVKHQGEWDAKNLARLQVRIWNPSDDPEDPRRSIAINNRQFGALTKLFIKPTIPFPVSFSLTGSSSLPPPPPPGRGTGSAGTGTTGTATQQQLDTQEAAGDKLESDKEARQASLSRPTS